VDHRSGSPGTGLWQAAGSYVQAEHSTFYANGTAVCVEAGGRPSRCDLNHCLLAGEKDAILLSVEAGGEVSRTNSIEGTIGDADTDPQLKAPTPRWRGGDDAFNSCRFPQKGARF
jgi:hypothetical protein